MRSGTMSSRRRAPERGRLVRLARRRLIVPVIALALTVGALAGAQSAFAVNGFTGSYEMQNWSASGPGTVTITPSSGPATSAQFSYALSGPSVWSYKSWNFSTTATASGTVSFDWTSSQFHAWYATVCDLYLYADGPSGRTTVTLVHTPVFGCGGGLNTSGHASIAVNAGYHFGLMPGGQNFDSTSVLQGTITLSNFSGPPFDTTPPVASPTQSPAANGAGWNNTDVTVNWNWADEAGGSGIDASSCTTSSTSTGEGTITLAATCNDVAGNTGHATYTVMVDKTAPVVSVPSDMTAEATGPGGAAVSFSASASDNLDPSVAATCSPASGSTFALGSTTVTCSATDAAGNTGTASFAVNVVDTTPPVVSVPSNITAEATGPAGAAVSFSASASDLVDVTDPVTCSPASGSTFALGSTTVTCSATDAAGNTGTASFAVNVVDTTPPSVSASLVAVRRGGDDESTQSFRVVFSATDAVGVTQVSASLNGVPVSNGQVVQLKTTRKGEQRVKREDGKLQIQATSFLLTVSASDAAGNTGTTTAAPVFTKHGEDGEGKKHGS